MSWVMRIQNYVSFSNSIYEFPLNEISTLFMPSLYPENKNPNRPPLRRQSSEDHPPPEDDKSSIVASGSVSSLPGEGYNSMENLKLGVTKVKFRILLNIYIFYVFF